MKNAIRIPANDSLERDINESPTRPVGRPGHKPVVRYQGFLYQAAKMTRLSCHRFRSNEVRLWLSVMAYNLGNPWRGLGLANRIGNWWLTSLQRRLVRHTRYYRLRLAAGHLTKQLFGAMVGRIAALPVATE